MEKEYDENVDSQNDEEEVETTEEVEEAEDELEDISGNPTLEDYEKSQAQIKELEEKNKQLYARIKKGGEKPNKPNIKPNDEESLLRLAKIANTLDDEDLEALKSINGSSIAEKVDNPLFKAFKAEKERKLKQKQSELSPSIAGRTFSKTDPNDPTISPEDREAKIKKAMGL